MNTGRLITLLRWIAAAAVLCAIVAVYHYWLHVNPTTVALSLLLFILVLGSQWGLRYAVVTSIAAAALFNFFFLPPIGTFTIADTQNWVALFAFLGTSLIASHLSNRIKTEAQQARARQREVEMLFQLSRELLQNDKVAELLNAIPQCVESATNASAVALYLDKGERLYFSKRASGRDLDGIDPHAATLLPRITVQGAGWNIIPLREGVKPRGALILQDGGISEETLEALGGLVSIGIDRAEALEDAARSEAAKENERLRTALLDSVTHELRTPLTAIKASATALLSQNVMNPEDQADMLTVIDEESDRLDRLISQAVQMAQLDSHEIHMDFAPHTVAELVENAMQSCAPTIAHHPLELQLPKDLPRVMVDSVWIVRVLSNLLENAAKYSASGQPIFLSAEERAGFVAISIANRGLGIEPIEQELIFDKFYRGQGQRRRVSGTGMGLAICRAIVEAHHGTIEVASQPGHGSVFTFTLPAAP